MLKKSIKSWGEQRLTETKPDVYVTKSLVSFTKVINRILMWIYSNVFVQFQVQLSQEELQRIITEAKEELGCHNIITF